MRHVNVMTIDKIIMRAAKFDYHLLLVRRPPLFCHYGRYTCSHASNNGAFSL